MGLVIYGHKNYIFVFEMSAILLKTMQKLQYLFHQCIEWVRSIRLNTMWTQFAEKIKPKSLDYIYICTVHCNTNPERNPATSELVDTVLQSVHCTNQTSKKTIMPELRSRSQIWLTFQTCISDVCCACTLSSHFLNI